MLTWVARHGACSRLPLSSVEVEGIMFVDACHAGVSPPGGVAH